MFGGMFGGVQKALIKKMMSKQLAQLPPEQRAMFEKLVDEHPELLMQIAQDVQAEMKAGKDQMAAMQSVAIKHQDALKKALGK